MGGQVFRVFLKGEQELTIPREGTARGRKDQPIDDAPFKSASLQTQLEDDWDHATSNGEAENACVRGS